MRCVRFAPFVLAPLITAGAQAATVSSNFTMTGNLTVSGTSYVITGQATMSGVYSGNGTFASSPFSLTGTSVTVPFTITVTAGNTLIGNFTFASAALATPSPGSLTITGGTGSYNGYTTSTAFSLTETGSLSGTSFAVSFTGSGTVNTTGGGTTTAPPTIAAVLDSASNTPNIAQGSIFGVYGTNLTPSSPGLTNLPRPTVLGGVKVTFTPVAGGAGTDVYLVYVGKQTGYDQINAILPSTVPVGTYNVTVTNGTVSNQFLTQVVATKVGLFTQDETGTGLAVVFNYISQSESDVNRLTTGNYNGSLSSPAKPGQTLVAWGTGVGPYATADNAALVYHDFSTSEPITAIVGGVSIPVAYAGRAGFAGEDQINFTLPANVPTGCAVTLQFSVNGALSLPTSISIAPSASATACVQPGYTTAQLQSLDQGGTITAGGFSLFQSVATDPSFGTYKTDSIGGSFTQITGFQLPSTCPQSYSSTTFGSCVVTHTTSTACTVTVGQSTSLDAGTVTLTGPSGTNLTNQVIPESSNAYNYSIGTEGVSIPGFTGNGSILQGTYTLNGAGGNGVGPFNTSITLGPPFTLNSPLPATVTESGGLTLNWTGGNASDAVQISGYSSTASGTGANQVTNSTGFICTTTVGQQTFTVPASILTQLPTTPIGILGVSSSVTPVNFSPTLKNGGGTIPSTFGYTFTTGGTVAYQ